MYILQISGNVVGQSEEALHSAIEIEGDRHTVQWLINATLYPLSCRFVSPERAMKIISNFPARFHISHTFMAKAASTTNMRL